MGSSLKHSNLPPGAIVQTYQDGGALRNDGIRLHPASQNPWYVLATVAGEQDAADIFEFDGELHARNRRFWNGWMCKNINEGRRVALAEKLGLPAAELAPLGESEMERVRSRFNAAFSAPEPDEVIPAPDAAIDFCNVHFPQPVIFGSYAFTVSVLAKRAHFSADAFFLDALFTDTAEFEETHFNGETVFAEAYFNLVANFQAAHFSGDAFFMGANFMRSAEFQEARFEARADFTDGYFAARTGFKGTAFKVEMPRFFNCQMHQDTSFSDDLALWPEATRENASDGKKAYTRLRQVAAEIYDQDLEHFFLRQEMQCKETLAGWFDKVVFILYRWFADSGISVARPFWLLVFFWAFGFACFSGYFDSGVFTELPPDIQDSRYRAAAGVSFGNLFGFLGINRLYFTDLLQDHIPDGLQFVAGLQTFAGVVLLFLLGLGLRNRFRLR